MAGTTADKLSAVLASKSAIKTAIENKGVEVGIAPLREYAGLIDGIETGSGTAPVLTGTATAAEVLTGKTFYSDDAEVKLTGTMPNQGAKTYTPSTVNQYIPAGYHNGSGKVNGDTNLVASNIKSGVSIFGVIGTIPGVEFSKDCTSIVAEGLFKLVNSNLSSITIPDSVTSIGNGAFNGCSGLTSVTIPNSVTSIGNSAFRDCTGLTSVTIPDSVTSIGNSAFAYCTGLTSITIPDTVTSIGASAFQGCTGLTSITIPDSVTSIGNNAFRDCRGLTSITISNSVTSIGSTAFKGCTGLTSVTLGDSVTSIGDYAFQGCTGLTSITIPNSVTSIGNGAFSGCTGLTSITISNSVTSIGNYAFYGCTGLTSVTLGDNFDATLDVSSSTLLTATTMVEMFNQLKNNTGYTAKVLTLGADNLAKLSAEQKAIATDKNWTLA